MLGHFLGTKNDKANTVLSCNVNPEMSKQVRTVITAFVWVHIDLFFFGS